MQTHKDLIFVLIIYSALVFCSIYYHHYHFGADGISYVSIAEKYFNGNWSNAINGCWSPLYSWLMTPFLFFGFDNYHSVYVTRIVTFIVGFFTIIGMSMLSSAFNLEKTVKKVLLLTLIPIILYYSVYLDTPDLLVVCLLVYYFYFIFNDDYPNKRIYGVICGFLGSLAFFAKSYIFPFFLVHFIFFNVYFYFKGLKVNKKRVKTNFILGLVVFLAVSGLWIGVISSKYDKITIGTANEYNYAIISPEYNKQHPVYFLGLIKPPNDSATSTWEEPSLVKINHWSPFESWTNFKFQLHIINENLWYFATLIKYYAAFSLAIITLSLYLIFKPKTEKTFRNRLIYLTMTFFLYPMGYLIFFVQERYIWPIIILVMFCGFYLISKLHQDQKLKYRNIFLIILIVSFTITPTYLLLNYNSSEKDDTASIYLAKKLKNDYGIQGNIASNIPSNELWEDTNRIAFYLDSQYYGIPKDTENFTELEKELKANDIDYYFVWGDAGNVYLFDYREITNGKIENLRIFQKIG
ncbi:MAG TPA: hypothetical protein GX531_03765 [Methanothermobacter sp.]|nr:hypothetical protein [Methanothermobacter sp.]